MKPEIFKTSIVVILAIALITVAAYYGNAKLTEIDVAENEGFFQAGVQQGVNSMTNAMTQELNTNGYFTMSFPTALDNNTVEMRTYKLSLVS